ncbi:Mfa1 family fimbria major subunit [Parabacteroides merdae]|nr:Mfa1 family fimbria major subunit [Parabacteroides merdae]
MNTKRLLFSSLIVLILTGCSTNEDNLINRGEDEQGNSQLRYLAVNIVTPKEPGVRSAMEGDFEPGSEAEDNAEKATFVLLDKNDNVVSVIPDQDLAPWKGLGSYEPNVENISTAVLVVKDEKTQPDVTGILAILNAPSGLNIAKEGDDMKTTLAGIKEIAGNYGTNGDKGTFIMTNSVYVKDNGIKIAADVTATQFAKSEDATKNNPVNIYVERVVAKITTEAVENIITQITQGGDKFNRGASVQINGQENPTNLTIDIKGIQIANSADQSYLFKNVEGFETAAPWAGWTKPEYFRSYWANMPTSGVTYTNHSWNQISGEGDGNTPLPLTSAHSFYVQENVIPTTSTADSKQHTSVIVTAQLKKENNPFEFVQIGGIYYEPDNGLTEIANRLVNRRYYIKTSTTENGATKETYESIPKNYLEWATKAPASATDVKGWEGFARLKSEYESKTFYQYVDNVAEGESHYQSRTAAQINTALQEKALRALKWTNGMCYYFVDIEHFGTETTGEGDAATTVQRKGIIRNHVYKLTLKSLQGLGVPVFDPEKEIIPENPPKNEELFYLAARVNILKWKIVSQQIDFNN